MTSKNSLENSLKRLDEILSKMQDGTLPLEEALKLYQEANGLVTYCTKTLTDAEKKVEMLIKERESGLKLDAEGKPQTSSFE